jgi:hypothetical protein
MPFHTRFGLAVIISSGCEQPPAECVVKAAGDIDRCAQLSETREDLQLRVEGSDLTTLDGIERVSVRDIVVEDNDSLVDVSALSEVNYYSAILRGNDKLKDVQMAWSGWRLLFDQCAVERIDVVAEGTDGADVASVACPVTEFVVACGGDCQSLTVGIERTSGDALLLDVTSSSLDGVIVRRAGGLASLETLSSRDVPTGSVLLIDNPVLSRDEAVGYFENLSTRGFEHTFVYCQSGEDCEFLAEGDDVEYVREQVANR